MPVSSLKHLSCSFLAVSLLMLAVVQLASAQPRKSQHNIYVFSPRETPEQSEMCYYRIDQQDDQDTLRITPAGTVRFYTARDLWVDIEVQDDVQGRRGAQGNGSANLRRGRPVAQLTVRDAIGETTEHKVSIRCCSGRSPNACTEGRWVEAQPYNPQGQSLGAHIFNEVVWPESSTRVRPHGPHVSHAGNPSSAAFPPLPPLPGGGPVMEIDEDN